MPEAVKEGGDVVCANGETIANLLVVNKVMKVSALQVHYIFHPSTVWIFGCFT